MEENLPKNPPPDDGQSWLYKIVVLPKYLGEFIFDILGRSEASDVSKFILGYMLLAAVLLLLLGMISPDLLQELLHYFFRA